MLRAGASPCWLVSLWWVRLGEKQEEEVMVMVLPLLLLLRSARACMLPRGLRSKFRGVLCVCVIGYFGSG